MEALISEFKSQFRSCRSTIIVVISIAVLIAGAISFLHLYTGASFGELTRDPAAVFEAPFYVGFLSQLGIFMWSSSAAICLFSAAIFMQSSNDMRTRNFFIFSGLLSLMLGFDDVFLLHENVFPHFGIPEKIVLVTYALLTLTYLVRFFATILKTDYVLLLMALSFFSFSVLSDILLPEAQASYLIEDSMKMMGQISWVAYYFRAGLSWADVKA